MNDHAPPMSWFAPPEGVYTLVSSLNVPAPSSTPVAPPTPLPGQPAPSQPDPNAPQPPPAHPSKLALVSIKFGQLSSSGGLAGLGMSMGGRGKAKASTAERDAASSSAGTDSLSSSGLLPPGGLSDAAPSASNTNPDSSNGGPASPGLSAPTSPLLKRRPLTSTFSIPTLAGLASAASGLAASSSSSADGPAPIATARPGRAFRGTNSTFVRTWEGLPLSVAQMRAFAEGSGGAGGVKAAGGGKLFGFWLREKGVVWSEIGMGRPKEPIARVTFGNSPTCIDVNQYTAGPNQVDVLVGFVSGDIFWFDPLSARYTRINKAGVITPSAVTSIKWLPPSPKPASPNTAEHINLFVTSHADGTVLLWDKDREDTDKFVPTPYLSPNGTAPPLTTAISGQIPSTNGGIGAALGKDDRRAHGRSGSEEHAPMPAARQDELAQDIIVTRPPQTDKKGLPLNKFNPVSHWRLSRKAITAIAWSPDWAYCATVGEDGCLRIIRASDERLLDTFAGYFGALTCVSWSPDGRFVLTGGQDDLVTIYSPLEQRVVASCVGHSSWVTDVAWDAWRSDHHSMRFASVGEDCKLILWDLSSAALTRPKAHAHPHHAHHAHAAAHRRMSAASTLSLGRHRAGSSAAHLPHVGADGERPDQPVFHPARRRAEVSGLQPVMVKVLSNDLFEEVHFLPEFIVTLSRGGQIKQWDRPPVVEGEEGFGMVNMWAQSEIQLDARAR